MKKCIDHYPILGSWKVVVVSGHQVTYQCPHCEETYTGTRSGTPIEVTTDEIRRQRIDYAPDMIQSHRGGELSKEFVQLHPDRVKGMLKEGAVTQKEVDNAKDVWKKDMPGLSHL